MKFKILLLFIFMTVVFADVQAQSDKKKQKKSNKKEQYDPYQNRSNSLSPNKNQSRSKEKKKNRTPFFAIFNKQLDDKVDQFYERMEANAKRDRKIRRKMDHPMYSDFSYFGHKRKPKIRPVGKKKFCKECGIKH